MIMKILVTNDDGIHAPGITALAVTLKHLGTVAVVAPDRERSAIGHQLHCIIFSAAPNMLPVDGTPTDCVNLGVSTAFLILSPI